MYLIIVPVWMGFSMIVLLIALCVSVVWMMILQFGYVNALYDRVVNAMFEEREKQEELEEPMLLHDEGVRRLLRDIDGLDA